MYELVFVALLCFFSIFFFHTMLYFCTIIKKCFSYISFIHLRLVPIFPSLLSSIHSCFCLLSFPSACLRLRYVCLLFPCSHIDCIIIIFFPLTCYFPNKRSWRRSYWFKTHRPVGDWKQKGNYNHGSFFNSMPIWPTIEH